MRMFPIFTAKIKNRSWGKYVKLCLRETHIYKYMLFYGKNQKSINQYGSGWLRSE